MTDNVAEATAFAPCNKCGAAQSDPCRTPSGKVTKPHAERMTIEDLRAAQNYEGDSAEEGIKAEPTPDSTRRQAQAPGTVDRAASPRARCTTVGSRQTIPPGNQIISPRGAKRRARKTARAAKRQTLHAAQVKGAKLAQARARQVRRAEAAQQRAFAKATEGETA